MLKIIINLSICIIKKILTPTLKAAVIFDMYLNIIGILRIFRVTNISCARRPPMFSKHGADDIADAKSTRSQVFAYLQKIFFKSRTTCCEVHPSTYPVKIFAKILIIVNMSVMYKMYSWAT
jgi:hypothetical protein